MPAPRVLIALAAAVVQMLSGCGWAPLYADIESGPASAINTRGAGICEAVTP